MTAVGYTSGDPSKVDRAGDTMTGDLVLDDTSPAASEAYVAAHGSGGGYFPFTQLTPSTSWPVPHNLGRYPAVTVVVGGLDVSTGVDVHHVDVNNLTINFGAAVTGQAVCS
jgi:acetyl esterase/lipase